MKEIKTMDMVRKIRDKQFQETVGKSKKEVIEYFNRKAESFLKETSVKDSNEAIKK